MSRRMGAALLLADLSEREWDAQLFSRGRGLASTLGWTSYHTLRSKGSRSGFPDRVLIRDRTLFVELKTEKGPLTTAQQEWLTGLAKAGAETYLWRPSDLEDASKVLAKRWRYLGGVERPSLSDPHQIWTPGSLWLPNGHRADAQLQQELVA